MPRILIVDDDATQRFLIEVMLQRAGFTTVAAENAPRALDLLRQDTDFDLILSDIRMPGMDGVAFIARARQLYPDIPVIVMTVHSNSEWVEQALSLGAAGSLGKPFVGCGWIDTVNAVIGRRESTHER